jgi:uncharacterized protein
VVTEVVHLLGTRLGTAAELLFLGDLAAGDFQVDPVAAGDWMRMAELVARYNTLRLGSVDASLVAACERLGIKRIATLDQRHFSVVRPRHVDAFDLVLPA